MSGNVKDQGGGRASLTAADLDRLAHAELEQNDLAALKATPPNPGARACSAPGCRWDTTDPSGRCAAHRDGWAEKVMTATPPPDIERLLAAERVRTAEALRERDEALANWRASNDQRNRVVAELMVLRATPPPATEAPISERALSERVRWIADYVRTTTGTCRASIPCLADEGAQILAAAERAAKGEATT